MSEHTKTPWAVGYGDGISGDVASWSAYMDEVECHEVVIRSGDEAVAIIYYGDPDGSAEANAQHIVNCVNNHEKLVEALQGFVDWPDERDWRGPGKRFGDRVEKARAILAQLQADKGGE